MITFIQGDVTFVSLTDVDVNLVLPYLKYSDYILRVLATLPDTVTKPVKYIEYKIRAALGYRLSDVGVQDFRQLQEVYEPEIATKAMNGAPYFVTVAVSKEIQECLQNIPDLELRTLETRLPDRYDPPNLVGQDGFTFFMNALCHPRPVRGGGYCWNNPISAPQYTPVDWLYINRTHIDSPWNQIFPRLFTVRRDLAPVRADISRVLAAFASDRRVSEGHVRKALGMKS